MDNDSCFSQVPDDSDAPGYSETIANPVAFDTMRAKLRNRQYGSFSDFEVDVEVMLQNCEQYNTHSSAIARGLRKLAKEFRSRWNFRLREIRITVDERGVPEKVAIEREIRKLNHGAKRSD